MTTTTTRRSARRSDIEGKTLTRRSDPGPLASLFTAGRRAVAKGGGVERPDGQYVRDVTRSPLAAVNGALVMRAALPDLLDADGRPVGAPAAIPSAETRTFRAAVMEASRVCRFGAHLIEIAEPELRGGGPEPVLAEQPTRFATITPAAFTAPPLSATADSVEGEITASPLPVNVAELDRGATTQFAWRTEILRSDMRDYHDAQLERWAMWSIALGLARVIDQALLGALVAEAPAAFSIAAAAAAGIRAQELRALVGTGGAGAAFDRGDLFVAGIAAEATDAVAETLVGCWDRFAVAVEPEISVMVERTSKGSLVLTCWTDVQPLVPDLSFVWTVT